MSSGSLLQQEQPLEENRGIDFNPHRLSDELLSLGNPKITPALAGLISEEVEKELKEKNYPLLTAEVVSEVVRFKLEEFGLIKIEGENPLKKRPRVKKNQIGKSMMKTHQAVLTPPPSLRLAIQPQPARPSKVEMAWSEEGKITLLELPLLRGGEKLKIDQLTPYLEDLSRAIASVDSHYDHSADIELTTTHFYNDLASLNFVPGTAIFKTDLQNRRPSGFATAFWFNSKEQNSYSVLQKITEERKEGRGASLGVSPEDSFSSSELFFQLLKTSLEYHRQNTQEKLRQDIFLQFPSCGNEDPFFRSALQWLQQEENHSYFSLSLGVPGRSSHDPTHDPGSSESDLIQVLHQHLLMNPSLRLFFLERSSDTPSLLPTPFHPSFLAAEEIIPSAFINLASLVEEEEISWDKLRRTVRDAVHFLDNVLDFWSYPHEISERLSKAERNIALGVMGLADLFYLLRIPYQEEEAFALASRLAQFIEEEAIKASSELAKKRGVFPNYIGSNWQKKGIPIRNAHLCSVLWDLVPSLIAQVSSGIEPHSVLVAKDPLSEERSQFLMHPFFAHIAKQRGFFTEPALHEIVEKGSLQNVSGIPEDVQKVFVVASDIEWESHLRMAYAFERHFDHGVAKICPLTLSSNKTELLKEILERSEEWGLRSLWIKKTAESALAVPESSSASLTPSSDSTEETAIQAVEIQLPKSLHYHRPRPRPDRLQGITHKFQTSCGTLYVTLNQDEEGPFELFAQLGKSAGCTASQNETISRLISLALRSGVDPEEVYEQLRGIGCSHHHSRNGEEHYSCADAIASVIAYHTQKRD